MRKPERVRLAEIDLNDPPFVCTLSGPSQELENSIRALGMINPPLLRGRDVVCGYRRLLVARGLAWVEVDAWIVSQDRLTVEGAVETALADNLSHRGVSEAEKAIALAKLVCSLDVPSDRVVSRHLPLLGIKPSHEALNRYLVVGSSSRAVLELLHRGRIGFGTACTLSSLSRIDREELCHVLVRTGLGVNGNREIVQGLMDLAVRGNRTVRGLLAEGWVGALMGAPPGFRPVPGRQLVEELRLRLRPRLEQSRRAVRSGVAKWSQRLRVKVEIPPGERGRPWTVKLGFTTPEELRRKAGRLTDGAVLSELGQLMGTSELGSEGVEEQGRQEDET